jgi:hypothetical protein
MRALNQATFRHKILPRRRPPRRRKIGKLQMWKWLRHRFGGGAPNVGHTLGLRMFDEGALAMARTRKGKSIFADAISAAGAEDGDTVEIGRDGQARVIGRRPKVIVDNTK